MALPARSHEGELAGNILIGFNRGVASAGDRIFMLTDNAHMIALNRFNGELLWETEMADWHQNYNRTSAPLTVGNLVISGTARGGDEGVRGFVAAFDQSTGHEVWRVWTVPKPGEPGSETWMGTDVEHRSGATWMTGTYDAQLDTIYWPVGNPGPDFTGSERQGDNLYTDSILALEPKTGKLKWYFQFTPHDVHDWDAQEPPVLVDTTWQGQPRKLLLQANRNGFFYVLDRTDGKLLLAKPFLKKLNWAEGIGADGRPILKPPTVQANGDTYVCPGFQGGTNWFSTSFNPVTGGCTTSTRWSGATCSASGTGEWEANKSYMGGTARLGSGRDVREISAGDQYSDGRGGVGSAAGERVDHGLCGSAIHRVGRRFFRREQRFVHGCGRGGWQDAVAVPDQSGLESLADDVCVR